MAKNIENNESLSTAAEGGGRSDGLNALNLLREGASANAVRTDAGRSTSDSAALAGFPSGDQLLLAFNPSEVKTDVDGIYAGRTVDSAKAKYTEGHMQDALNNILGQELKDAKTPSERDGAMLRNGAARDFSDALLQYHKDNAFLGDEFKKFSQACNHDDAEMQKWFAPISQRLEMAGIHSSVQDGKLLMFGEIKDGKSGVGLRIDENGKMQTISLKRDESGALSEGAPVISPTPIQLMNQLRKQNDKMYDAIG